MAQKAIVGEREGPATAVEAAAGLRDVWWRRLLFMPTIGLLLLLAIVPLMFSLGVSLFNYSIGSKPIWVGLGNYVNMFIDPQFWLATKVTVQFTVAAVSIEVVLGILLGFVMNQRFTGMGIIRLIVFLPMMLVPLVVGLFWRFMFDQTFGVIDYMLTQVGLPAIPWLIDTFWARVAVVTVDVWQWTPFVTLLVLAGLGTVPADLLEAATLDRASNWMKFREFENGAVGLVEDSWARHGGMDDRIEVYGDGGVTYASLHMGNALPTFSEHGYGYAVEKAPGTKGWTYPVYEELWNYGFPQEMHHFARCVRGKEEPVATGEDGRVVQEVLYAGYESARTGCKVELPFRPQGVKRPIDLWFGAHKG